MIQFWSVYLESPVRSDHPKGGPDTASIARHVAEVEDYKSMGVLDCARQADAVPPAASRNICIVDLHENDAVLNIPQTGILCTCFVHVIDIAMGRVVLLGRDQSEGFVKM